MDQTETILVIDDDPFIRMVLRGFLEDLGVAVEEAADGPEGLARVAQRPPSLVLLDITMPGLDGFEVCRRIRLMPEAADTPVLVLTAVEGTGNKVEAFRCGAVDFISKPFQLEEVVARVRAHLGLRRQNLELQESRDSLRKALHDTGAMNRNLIALNEKLARSEEVKTRFLAQMRNEINNPLGNIMGLANHIADPGTEPERARQLAALIKEEAFSLDRQIQDVFSAAELESGQADPFFARVDVASLARDVLASYRPAARAKGLELVLLEAGDLAAFPTDGEKVHHVLSNLVAFAIQCAAPQGRVELRAEGGERLVLTVVDHGPGLSEEEARAVFDPFRMPGGALDAQHHQRLGMPVVKALVDFLGGDLRVESSPGMGSAFRVSLPSAPSSGAEDLGGNTLIFDEPQEF